MAVRALFRSYGGENLKDRPEYYSKLSCLLSFLRAAEAAGVEPVFLNDGPIPEDRLRVMQSAGEVVELPGVGMRQSYLAGLRLVTDGRWSGDDVAWMSEDDYLYSPEALVRLGQVADAVPEAEYFALYGSTPAHPATEGQVPDDGPRGWRDLAPWEVDGQAWVRIRSTASTFGARIGALTDDLGVFRLCMAPHRHMYRDHDTCLVYQGFEPYTYGELARAAAGLTPGSVRDRIRGMWLSPFLLATNLRAHRRADRRRILVAADPNLASHMEDALMAPGVDWRAVHEETGAWAADRGLIGTTSPAA
ncbi:hypothetical protein ACI78R_17960 [Geodermatophilus sp. SYSU D01106]